MEKPSVEQVAWIFSKIIENAQKEGSFRYLIYDTLGFDESNYLELYEAGGMAINNHMLELYHPEYKEINEGE